MAQPCVISLIELRFGFDKESDQTSPRWGISLARFSKFNVRGAVTCVRVYTLPFVLLRNSFLHARREAAPGSPYGIGFRKSGVLLFRLQEGSRARILTLADGS